MYWKLQHDSSLPNNNLKACLVYFWELKIQIASSSICSQFTKFFIVFHQSYCCFGENYCFTVCVHLLIELRCQITLKCTHKEQHTNVTTVVVVKEYNVVAISIPQMTTIWRFMVNGYYYYVPSEKSM